MRAGRPLVGSRATPTRSFATAAGRLKGTRGRTGLAVRPSYALDLRPVVPRWRWDTVEEEVLTVDLHVREHRLPGIGNRYDIALGRGQRLVIVVQHDGGRSIGVMDEYADEPSITIRLAQEQAVAVAALLTGARFTLDTSADQEVTADEVEIDTVALGPDSPAVGSLMRDIALPADSDAAVLAIIRDETPELVEDEEHTPVRPGDRLVVAARRDRIGTVVRHLSG